MTDRRPGRGRFGPKAGLVVGGLIIVYLLRYALLPFIVAAAVAYIVNPVVVAIERRCATSRRTAGTIVFVLTICVCGGAAAWIGLPVWHDVRDIVLALPSSLHKALAQLLHGGSVQVLGESFDANRLTSAILNGLRSFFRTPANSAEAALVAFVAVMGITLTVVLFFYFVVSGNRLLRDSAIVVPAPHRARYFTILRRLDPLLGQYLRGVAAIAVYAIIVSALGLTFLLGIPHPLFFAVVSGLLELLPVVGPIMAALIVGAVVVQQANIWLVFVFFAYLTALRLSIDQLAGPLVLGRVTALHPTVVIFALLAGGSIFGPLGLLLAVPTAVTVKVMLDAAETAG